MFSGACLILLKQCTLINPVWLLSKDFLTVFLEQNLNRRLTDVSDTKYRWGNRIYLLSHSCDGNLVHSTKNIIPVLKLVTQNKNNILLLFCKQHFIISKDLTLIKEQWTKSEFYLN